MNANMSLVQEDEEMEKKIVCSRTCFTSPSLRMVNNSTISSHLEEDTFRLVEKPSHHNWAPSSSSATLVSTSASIRHNVHTFHPPHLLHPASNSLMPFTSTFSSSSSSSVSFIPLMPRRHSPQRQRHWCHRTNVIKPWRTLAQIAAVFLLLILISRPFECAVLVSQSAVSTSTLSTSGVLANNSSSRNSSSSGTTRIFNFSQYSVPHLVYPTLAYSSSPSHQTSLEVEDELGDLEMPYPFTEDGIFAVGGSLDVCQVCWCNKVDELDCRYRPDQPSEITLIPMLPKRDDRLKIVEM